MGRMASYDELMTLRLFVKWSRQFKAFNEVNNEFSLFLVRDNLINNFNRAA